MSKETVHSFCSLINTILINEQNSNQFFEFFVEKNFLQFYSFFFQNLNDDEMVIHLLKSYSHLTQNLKLSPNINYLFSNHIFNEILNLELNLKNEDIAFYFVNLVKSITQRMENFPSDFFYNHETLDFPLLQAIARFINAPDKLVRITAFNGFLNLLRLEGYS